MKKMGIREAKKHLSALVKGAANGDECTITDRGVPVAKIVPIPKELEPLDVRLARLVENGTLVEQPEPAVAYPLPDKLDMGVLQKMLRMLDEDRNR